MTEDSNFAESFQEVLHDLDEFIYQKNRLLLVSAFIQIKKISRKKHLYKRTTSNKQPSFSNCSEKYSKISKQSQVSKKNESEHFSDIIQGVQSLNQIRQKIQLNDHPKFGYRPKIALDKINDDVRDTLSNHQHEYQKNSMKSFNSNKSPNIRPEKKQIKFQQRNQQRQFNFQNSQNVVPRLVGLTSQQQISDIQPFYQKNRRANTKSRNNIVEQQDDDEEFQDMILDRLSKIQENVNRIIQQKRKKQVNRGMVGQPISSKSFAHSKVPGYMSGSITPNKSINHKRGNNSSAINIYQNQTSRDIQRPYLMLGSRLKSSSINSPRVSEGVGNINIALQGNSGNSRPHRVSNQKYFAQRLQKSKQRSGYQGIKQSQSLSEHDVYNKSKKLGHYRESQNYIDQERNQPNKSKSNANISINCQKIREQGNQLDSFKYIPLSKVNLNSQKRGQQNKTERIHHNQQPNNRLGYQKYQKVQMNIQKQPNSSNSESHINYARYVPKNNNNQAINYQGHRRRQLEDSNVKSYTQHVDYVNQDQQIRTDKEEISKKLKKLTQKFGYVLQRQGQKQRNGHRSYQATQRIMYPVRSKQVQRSSQDQVDYQKQISVSYKWRRVPEQNQKYVSTYSKNYHPNGINQRNITTQEVNNQPKRKYSSNSFSQISSTGEKRVTYQRNSKKR